MLRSKFLLKFQTYASFVLFYYLFTLIPTESLRCYQCGEYTDGIGSITSCMNYTDEQHLRECLDTEAQCVKYVMHASTVRGCLINCTEKVEKWGTKIYCCNDNACNSATAVSFSFVLIFSLIWIFLLYSNISCNSV